MRIFTIAEMAKIFGSSRSAIRFYEEHNLIHPVRNASGHRIYSYQNFLQLFYLSRYKEIGFTLHETDILFTSENDSSLTEVFDRAVELEERLEEEQRRISNSLGWLREYHDDLRRIRDDVFEERVVHQEEIYYITDRMIREMTDEDLDVLSVWVKHIPYTSIWNEITLGKKEPSVSWGIGLPVQYVERWNIPVFPTMRRVEEGFALETIIRAENADFSMNLVTQLKKYIDQKKAQYPFLNNVQSIFYTLIYSHVQDEEEIKYYKVFLRK